MFTFMVDLGAFNNDWHNSQKRFLMFSEMASVDAFLLYLVMDY